MPCGAVPMAAIVTVLHVYRLVPRGQHRHAPSTIASAVVGRRLPCRAENAAPVELLRNPSLTLPALGSNAAVC